MTLIEMMNEAISLSMREIVPEWRAGAAIAKDAAFFRACLQVHAFKACQRNKMAELFNQPDFGPFMDALHTTADETVRAALHHFIQATTAQ